LATYPRTGEKPFGIFDDDPSGFCCVDQPEVLVEESVELPVEAGFRTGEPEAIRGGLRGVSAWESTEEDGGGLERCAFDIADVSHQRDVGEPAFEHRLAVLVDLDHDLVLPPGLLEADLEPADAREC